MPLTENEELWYKNQIKKYDPKGGIFISLANINI